jgi:membrane fusion protein, heavy metal efflux system
MKKIINYLLVLAATGSLAGCNSNAVETTTAKTPFCISDSMSRMIQIESASVQNVDDELKLSGEVSFNENKVVKIFPVSSGQVTSVKVSIGDYVHKGEVLATIKSADIAANYSDLKNAGSDVILAKRAMENAEHLYQNGIGSQRDYLEAKENYGKALASEHKIESQISINGNGHTSASGSYVVTAPKNGYLVEKNINPGQFIRNDNGQNMFTVGDTHDVWIWANVYESDIARVKEGYTAFVSTLAYPDSVFTGKVDKMNQILDPQTKVMKIRIVLPNNDGALKPAMFANITIRNSGAKKAVAVPTNAIINDEGKSYVIIYHDKCNLEIRQIQVTKTSGNYSFIGSGVTAGEQMVSENQLLLYHQLEEK